MLESKLPFLVFLSAFLLLQVLTHKVICLNGFCVYGGGQRVNKTDAFALGHITFISSLLYEIAPTVSVQI